MFLCDSCRAVFAAPLIRTALDYGGLPAERPAGLCPVCGDEAFEYAESCGYCGGYYPCSDEGFEGESVSKV